MTRNTASTSQYRAIEKASAPIFKGAFDYSSREKFFYFFVAPTAAAYFSWESVKFYFELGGNGTKYLPFGTFSKEFGGQAAFWSNFSLNWFFMMDTLISIRRNHLYYQHAKKLGLNVSAKKIATKLTIAFFLAAASGTVMALIAGNKRGTYNQLETGAVSMLLNYLGSLALQLFVAMIFGKAKDLIFKKLGLKDNVRSFEARKTDSWLTAHLQQRKHVLLQEEKIPANFREFTTHAINSSYHVIIDEDEAGILKKTALGIFHILLQIADKISLYGFWKDTMKSLQEEPFSISSSKGANILGSGIFIPFVSLTSKVTFDTANEIIGMAKSARKNIADFSENPVMTRETIIKLSVIAVLSAFAIAGYFFAYVSSNSGLELNAEYDWDDWWNIYPTTLATTIFNGFGFLGILMASYSVIIPNLIYTAEKRNVINAYDGIIGFFDAYPEAVDHLSAAEPTGLKLA